MSVTDSDVLIIGAGPSGAVAAALLCKRGYRVEVLEKTHFPRFSIGESLLPQCMDVLDEAGFTARVAEAGFQLKDGAVFVNGAQRATFDFRDKSVPGWDTTHQVVRADFDHLLAEGAEAAGARIRFGCEIVSFDFDGARARLNARMDTGRECAFAARFVLDASGFGRVLPRLLSLEWPSTFPVRRSLFTHVEDRISNAQYDRQKILIAMHPVHHDVWYWLIPFSDGRSSVGVVATPEFLDGLAGEPEANLRTLIGHESTMAELLGAARYDTPVREITGYSADVTSLHGPGFALLGNAGEFLDPIFSSGVTIALKSASLAAGVLDLQLRGESVDWERDFATPLRKGIDTFRAFVEFWYDGRFQDIVFYPDQQPQVKRMLTSVLAGYAWDVDNPYVARTRRRLDVLARLCRR